MTNAAIILAAGLSSRMREFKPMLFVGEMSMIHRIIHTLKTAGVENIIVVTGYQAEKLKKHVQSLGVSCVYNAAYANTQMYDSLKIGLRVLPDGLERVLIMPADVPLVCVQTVRELLNADVEDAACPTYQGRSGHPLIISGKWVPFLLEYGGEGGLQRAVAVSNMQQRFFEVDNAGILLDADTTDDYYSILKADTALRGRGKLTFRVSLELIGTEPFFNSASQQLLELTDSTGSIQTACGCMHLSYTSAWKMLKQMEGQLGMKLLKRTVGGAEGGGSALTEEGISLVQAYRVCMQAIQVAVEEEFEKQFSWFVPNQKRAKER